MKVIKVPKELLNLPTPWRHTDLHERRQQLKTIGNGAAPAPSQIKSALNVLERCLRVLSSLSPPDSIPEEMMQYWAFEADFLAEKMPSFDEFHIDKVEEFLFEYGIESPSVVLQKDVATYWFWWVTWNIEDAILDFLSEALKGANDSPFVICFLEMAERYWQRLSPRQADALLLASASIGRQKALPLLLRVERTPSAPAAVKKSAGEYRTWILRRNDKSHRTEVSVEFSTNGLNQGLQNTLVPALSPMPA